MILKEAKVLRGPVEKKKKKVKDMADLSGFFSSSECKGYRNGHSMDFVTARKGHGERERLSALHCQHQSEM